jgi:hypothetical protein
MRKHRPSQPQSRKAKSSDDNSLCAFTGMADFRRIFAYLKELENNNLLQKNINFSIKEN